MGTSKIPEECSSPNAPFSGCEQSLELPQNPPIASQIKRCETAANECVGEENFLIGKGAIDCGLGASQNCYLMILRKE